MAHESGKREIGDMETMLFHADPIGGGHGFWFVKPGHPHRRLLLPPCSLTASSSASSWCGLKNSYRLANLEERSRDAERKKQGESAWKDERKRHQRSSAARRRCEQSPCRDSALAVFDDAIMEATQRGIAFITRSVSAPVLRGQPHPSSPGSSTASNPSGSRTTPATETERGSSPPGGNSGSPHQDILAAAVGEAEDWSGLDLVLFSISGGLMVGMLPEMKGLIDIWGTAEKVVFGVAVGTSMASLGIGLMTAGYHGVPMSRRRALSSFCARFSTVISTALFITTTSCKFGKIGCLAGASSAGVVAGIMASIWIYENLAVEAVSRFWGRLWRRREPAAAQSVQLARPQV